MQNTLFMYSFFFKEENIGQIRRDAPHNQVTAPPLKYKDDVLHFTLWYDKFSVSLFTFNHFHAVDTYVTAEKKDCYQQLPVTYLTSFIKTVPGDFCSFFLPPCIILFITLTPSILLPFVAVQCSHCGNRASEGPSYGGGGGGAHHRKQLPLQLIPTTKNGWND